LDRKELKVNLILSSSSITRIFMLTFFFRPLKS
jgi:hypothetical protein